MKWIKCSERMPEEEVVVMVWAHRWDSCYFGKRVDGFMTLLGSSSDDDHITHWQPLPEPPKEDA